MLMHIPTNPVFICMRTCTFCSCEGIYTQLAQFTRLDITLRGFIYTELYDTVWVYTELYLLYNSNSYDGNIIVFIIATLVHI